MKQFLYFNTKVIDRVTKPTADTKEKVGLLSSSIISEASSWVDLNAQFFQRNIPDVIACGSEQIFESDPKNFMHSLYATINLQNSKKITLCVPANNELDYDRIGILRELGFKGLVPPTPYYGAEASATSIKHFLNDQEYWPEPIINFYKDIKTTPTVVVFNDLVDLKNQLTISTSRFIAKQRENKNFKIELVFGWDELAVAIRKNPAALLFNSNMTEGSTGEFVSMLESLVKFSCTKRKLNIGAIITKQTPSSLVKELQQTNITGIVPSISHWDSNESLLGIMNVINAIPYWPGHILKQLPGQNIKPKKNNIELSYRQQQILNLIQTRGITNQQIADKLKIKEGTVKLHVGLLLKKYGVQNRTQLANL
jgi:DNA-binding NarL/FixJ family response regulator